MSKTTEVQYAVRYGDGDMDIFGPDLASVEEYVKETLKCIAAGQFDAEDYEPMTIVRRTVTVERIETPWESA